MSCVLRSASDFLYVKMRGKILKFREQKVVIGGWVGVE